MTDIQKLEAIEICKKVLSALSKNNFSAVATIVDDVQIEDLEEYLIEFLQGHLEDNGFDSVDEYGVECAFQPDYKYSPLSMDEYDDGSGFYLDYEMTSNGELIDLVLQLEFLYKESGLKSIFINIDPQ